ncbi:mrna-capping enzyme subunit alpha [Gossypium arboreum]|uniref:Mrna-capping enzyme subunit alpha n=1 Tax=Gossypium arboreum TaxID=29729 RepID=A0A0B0PSL7_GOSAR|nr:mrna-capping enzyme subunit alpha [Gossypium arboreum]
MIISLKYIPAPYRNNFILSLIVAIPNEPLGIIISDTRENLAYKVPHIHYLACSHKLSVKTYLHGAAHTSCQVTATYAGILATGRTYKISTRII